MERGIRSTNNMRDLEEMLRQAVEQEAADIFIVSGGPVCCKVAARTA